LLSRFGGKWSSSQTSSFSKTDKVWSQTLSVKAKRSITFDVRILSPLLRVKVGISTQEAASLVMPLVCTEKIMLGEKRPGLAGGQVWEEIKEYVICMRSSDTGRRAMIVLVASARTRSHVVCSIL
jgi:hypothetical protein